ncbi:MAG TPA: SCO family protein [Opitutaceae bacterium]
MINIFRSHSFTARRAARFGALCACLGSTFFFAGCGQKNGDTETKNEGYALKGEILGIDAAHNQLTIKHEEVKGLMPAMTMEFAATPGDIANAKVGQHIHARLIPEKNGDFHLEKIWVDDAAKNAVVDAAAKALVQDTVALGNKAYHDIGDTSPDFALYDENGNVVQSSRFRGKQIMINFIFTRCPVPTMCPASVARFQSTQKLARDAGVKNLELISITLDPAYDTPGVLKTYTMARGIDTSNYSFLTGPENAIKSLLSQFGVLAYFNGPLLDHTLATLLIDENGKIIYRVDGSRWQPEDFVSKMKKA